MNIKRVIDKYASSQDEIQKFLWMLISNIDKDQYNTLIRIFNKYNKKHQLVIDQILFAIKQNKQRSSMNKLDFTNIQNDWYLIKKDISRHFKSIQVTTIKENTNECTR